MGQAPQTSVRAGFRIFGLLAVIALGAAPGCASAPTVAYASDSLYLGNSMKRVALLSSAYVGWPRTGDKQSVLDIDASRKAQEDLLRLVGAQLTSKGYSVGTIVPAGVAFVSPLINYEDFYYLGPNEEERKVMAIAPVFIYPQIAASFDLVRAVRDLIEPMNAARKEHRVDDFKPNPTAVKFIASTLDPQADTFCYLHVVGDRYSAGRKFGAMMFHRSLNDDLYADLMCSSTSDGVALWFDGSLAFIDPTVPTPDFTRQLLQYFPARGMPMDPQVGRTSGGPVPTSAAVVAK
jgi:hypothetical protein